MVDILAQPCCHCGENPLWHPDEQALYWTDIPTGRLLRWRPGQPYETVYTGRSIGGFTLQADGKLLLFMDRGTVALFADDHIEREIIPELPEELDSRFNDVIADPEGRVFCGTMPTPDRKGRLYRLDSDGTITVLVEGVGCANGMGFTDDLKTMYFTDTPTRSIDAFDYDRATGSITGRRSVVQIEGEGYPDGMTVDRDGMIWSARWGGRGVFRYDPRDGSLLTQIDLPTTHCVTSLTFGGDDLADIFITTAMGHQPARHGPDAGALFHARLDGIAGRPEYRSRIT